MASNKRCIVDRALEGIQPARGQEAACRAEIEVACKHLEYLRDYFEGWLTPGVLKEDMRDLAKSLRTTIKRIKSLPPPDRELVFRALRNHATRIEPKALLAQLETLRQRVELLKKSLVVPKGGQRLDPMKLFAAHYANELLLRFANKSPTLTPEGPYLVLAGILYEGVTGKEGTDMRRACARARTS